MEYTYPWYDIAGESDELEQGDFIDNCKVLIPTYIPVELDTSAHAVPQEKFEVAGGFGNT